MRNVYTAVYKCKRIDPIGVPPYFDVILGVPMGNGISDITIAGTCARIEVGKEYVITVQEMP